MSIIDFIIMIMIVIWFDSCYELRFSIFFNELILILNDDLIDFLMLILIIWWVIMIILIVNFFFVFISFKYLIKHVLYLYLLLLSFVLFFIIGLISNSCLLMHINLIFTLSYFDDISIIYFDIIQFWLFDWFNWLNRLLLLLLLLLL